MRTLAVILGALACGIVFGDHLHGHRIYITWSDAHAQGTIHSAVPAQKTKELGWIRLRSVYEGAHRCEMTSSTSVACDNGYRGPLE